MNKIVVQFNTYCDGVLILRSVVNVLSERVGLNMIERNRVGLAVDELYANIVRHAYQKVPQALVFEADILQDGQGEALQFVFRDEAPPVQMSDWNQNVNMPSPCVESLEPGGLGVPLIHAIMDEVVHTALDKGNQWRLLYRCNKEEKGVCP